MKSEPMDSPRAFKPILESKCCSWVTLFQLPPVVTEVNHLVIYDHQFFFGSEEPSDLTKPLSPRTRSF